MTDRFSEYGVYESIQ